MSQTSLLHVFKGLIRCKSICDVKPGLDPCPLLAWSWSRWWLDFVSFIAYKKVHIKFKKVNCVSNRCNDLFKRKKYFRFRCTLNNWGFEKSGFQKLNKGGCCDQERWRREPLGGGQEAFSPRKSYKICASKMPFPVLWDHSITTPKITTGSR